LEEERDSPLSLLLKRPFTGGASEAEYWRMEPVSPEAARQRAAFPHAWHAAEMFLCYA
jgi:hypothetical protein